MKNIHIHETLDDKEIRDFLAKSAGSSYIGEADRLKERIAELIRQLKIAEKEEVVMKLIEGKGWECFDISDQITDYTSASYFPFVGTKEELEGQVYNDCK
jgi:hypothetical protein